MSPKQSYALEFVQERKDLKAGLDDILRVHPDIRQLDEPARKGFMFVRAHSDLWGRGSSDWLKNLLTRYHNAFIDGLRKTNNAQLEDQYSTFIKKYWEFLPVAQRPAAQRAPVAQRPAAQPVANPKPQPIDVTTPASRTRSVQSLNLPTPPLRPAPSRPKRPTLSAVSLKPVTIDRTARKLTAVSLKPVTIDVTTPVLRPQTTRQLQSSNEAPATLIPSTGVAASDSASLLNELQSQSSLGARMRKSKSNKQHDMTVAEAYEKLRDKLPTLAKLVLDQTEVPKYVKKLKTKGTGALFAPKAEVPTKIDFSTVEGDEHYTELKKATLEVRSLLPLWQRRRFDPLVTFVFSNLRNRQEKTLKPADSAANLVATIGLLKNLKPGKYVDLLSEHLL